MGVTELYVPSKVAGETKAGHLDVPSAVPDAKQPLHTGIY